ncbi:MAG: transcription antitermination factor NusB, partial [Oscillospiraceae bacterium]|nr:transcription antitermination factor NusB [Oscillospiraceae bacterium]
MNRSTAREIAVHLTFALAFSSESAEDLLARELTPDRFALRAKDEPLYAEFPGEGELAYVTRLARG